MPQSVAGPEIERLIQLLARLPGLGPRSARRAALHLIKKREQLLGPLSEALRVASERIVVCRPAATSTPPTRARSAAIPRRDADHRRRGGRVRSVGARARRRGECALSRAGRRASPLDGVRPEHLNLDRLVARASNPAVSEVILALNATVDGQTTAHYITEILGHLPVRVTKLAHGVPVGGELDYLDEGTLSAAIRQRTTF